MIGSRPIDASGRRASTGWPPTSVSSKREPVMTAEKRGADNELLIVRTFDAPPAAVFRLYLRAGLNQRRVGAQKLPLPPPTSAFFVGRGRRSTLPKAGARHER